jgi:hypothetical protein
LEALKRLIRRIAKTCCRNAAAYIDRLMPIFREVFGHACYRGIEHNFLKPALNGRDCCKKAPYTDARNA